MALRSAELILVLMLALTLVKKSSAGYYVQVGVPRACDGGLVGDCIDAEEEAGMESESMRRSLRGRGRGGYISYGALSKNRVPCGRRGPSYYNCNQRSKVNPYRRSCTAITRCARVLR